MNISQDHHHHHNHNDNQVDVPWSLQMGSTSTASPMRSSILHTFHLWFGQIEYFKYFILDSVKLSSSHISSFNLSNQVIFSSHNKIKSLSLSFTPAGTWWNQETTKLPKPWGNFMLPMATSGRASQWFVHLYFHFLYHWLFTLPRAFTGPHPHFFIFTQCHSVTISKCN